MGVFMNGAYCARESASPHLCTQFPHLTARGFSTRLRSPHVFLPRQSVRPTMFAGRTNATGHGIEARGRAARRRPRWLSRRRLPRFVHCWEDRWIFSQGKYARACVVHPHCRKHVIPIVENSPQTRTILLSK